MLPAAEDVCQPPWNMAAITALIDDLESLRKAMLEREAGLAPWVDAVAPARRASAANLAHYLALRQIDLRPIQDRLAGAGLSSLGRSETHVLANVDKVLGALHRIAVPLFARADNRTVSWALRCWRGRARLFGTAPAQRGVRIMVTLPSRRRDRLWSLRWCRAEWISRDQLCSR
jgi:pyruvate kinase